MTTQLAFAPEKTAPPVKRRLDYIDAVRGAACFWVLMHHTFQGMALPGGLWHFPAWALVHFANIGWLGVSMFLVLSGFCLFYPLAARYSLSEIQLNIATFARRRALRILPPYYAALLLLGTWKIILFHQQTRRWDWHVALHGPKYVILHLLMLHNLDENLMGSVNGAFWSLALESQLYVIFPLLVWIVMRHGLKALLAATFLLSFSWQLACYHHFGFSMHWINEFVVYYRSLPGRCFEFAAGMAAAYFVAHPRPGQSRIALALLLIPLGPALYFVSEVSEFGPLDDQIWGIIFAATLVLLGRVSDVRFQRHLVLRFFVWLGAISYSVYLMHQPLIGWLSINSLPIHNSLWRQYAFGFLRLPVLVGIGYLFHLFFERPFMPGRPRTERQAEVAAAISPAP